VIVKVAVVGAFLMGGVGLAALLATAGSNSAGCEVSAQFDGGGTEAAQDSLDSEQRSNLGTILAIGDRVGAGDNGKRIAVMTALTESSLRNLSYGDDLGPDSRGLFQQRSGWGPIEVRMDPAGAAGLFYAALLKLPRWSAMRPWEAAQAVQRSAYDDGANYRSNFALAARLVDSLTSGGCGAWATSDSTSLPGSETAIARAMKLVGHNGYYRLCARLAANIWGRPRAGYLSAAEQWDRMVAIGNAHPGDRRPPVGALIFWATDGPYGHVAVYVGGGRIVSNDIGDKAPGVGGVYLVDIGLIESRWHATYLGWAPPIYPTA
jgi:hypothetical protein